MATKPGSTTWKLKVQTPAQKKKEQDDKKKKNEEKKKAAEYWKKAAALYPWLPSKLLKVFVDSWVDSDDPQLALADMRDDKLYDQYFAGNRNKSGTFKMDEADYMTKQDQYRSLLKDYNLPASMGNGSLFGEFVGGDVSIDEIKSRLAVGYSDSLKADPTILKELQDMYGFTPGELASFWLDPEASAEELQRKWTSSQIGGMAAKSGWDAQGLSTAEAERLAASGVTVDEAVQGFSALSGQAQLMQGFEGEDGDVEREDQLGAAFGGDSETKRRLERRARGRVNQFGASGGAYTEGSKGVGGLGQDTN